MFNLEWIYITTNQMKLIIIYYSRFCFNFQSNQLNKSSSYLIFTEEKLRVVLYDQLSKFRSFEKTKNQSWVSLKEQILLNTIANHFKIKNCWNI